MLDTILHGAQQVHVTMRLCSHRRGEMNGLQKDQMIQGPFGEHIGVKGFAGQLACVLKTCGPKPSTLNPEL